MRRWHRLVLALYRIDLLLRIGYRRSSTTRASKTVRQLAPSDGEVAVVTPPSPQLPPSMVRLTALVIRSLVMLSPATVRNQRFSPVRVIWSGCSSTQGADAISTTPTTKKRPASTVTTREMITRRRCGLWWLSARGVFEDPLLTLISTYLKATLPRRPVCATVGSLARPGRRRDLG